MKFIESLRDKLSGSVLGYLMGGSLIRTTASMADEAVSARGMDRAVVEGLTDLELAIEDQGWREIGYRANEWNFSRSALRKMMSLSRLMYLANPLIKRATTVQELYVWGSVCSIEAEDTLVNEVLEDFFSAPKNQRVIGDSWAEREREQRTDGNTFFAFFTNPLNGSVRVRCLSVDDIWDVIYNPEDNKEPWYYKRSLPEPNKFVLYPDIDHNPVVKPDSFEDGTAPGDRFPIRWDVPVLHVKTGGLPSMKFGVPEHFSAINWAIAYKGILENFATILKAYARVAMQITNQKGKKDVAGSKSKLQTGIDSNAGRVVDNNPSTNIASLFLSSGGVQMSAVKTAHSTTGPDEARALRSMVASGTDTPEHFFGDSDIGNFATSTTLDRPTELKMISRQDMWGDVIRRMATFAIRASARAPQGKLRTAEFVTIEIPDLFDGQITYKTEGPNGRSMKFNVKFPNIVERDVVDRVRSVVQAITLNGNKAEGIIPNRKYAFRLLIEALGVKNVDEIVDLMYPADVEQGFIDPAKQLENETIAAKAKQTMADKPIPAPAGGPAGGNNGR